MSAEAMSFYFFDFDKNIMKVKVPIVLVNIEDGSEREITGKKYGEIRKQLEKPGKWQEWSGRDAYRYYSDLPDKAPEEQTFVEQIKQAIDSDSRDWQAPAWSMFVHACNKQRPFSLITARGHSDETVKAGFDVLKRRGLIEQTPNYLTIYNVSNPATRAKLGDPDGKLETDDLKRIATVKTVDTAVDKYGREPRHRFGMSDDTMTNVEFVADAMRTCKKTYSNMRFFVISTNKDHQLKAEIFPVNVPVTGFGDVNGAGPLSSYLD